MKCPSCSSKIGIMIWFSKNQGFRIIVIWFSNIELPNDVVADEFSGDVYKWIGLCMVKKELF